jgi:hypothetical protein
VEEGSSNQHRVRRPVDADKDDDEENYKDVDVAGSNN